MTLEEAIAHCEEIADKECTKCADDHRQLAEWLKELKTRRTEQCQKKGPEKIYITPHFERRWFTKEIDDDSVEYTRIDAFIEKALKWYCLDCECNDNCDANHNCAFRVFFKMYLEGNDKALPPKISNALNPDGSTTENYRYRHFIERISDDFVEKAISWLKEQDEIIGVSFQEDFLERFKNYMKGE